MVNNIPSPESSDSSFGRFEGFSSVSSSLAFRFFVTLTDFSCNYNKHSFSSLHYLSHLSFIPYFLLEVVVITFGDVLVLAGEPTVFGDLLTTPLVAFGDFVIPVFPSSVLIGDFPTTLLVVFGDDNVSFSFVSPVLFGDFFFSGEGLK